MLPPIAPFSTLINRNDSLNPATKNISPLKINPSNLFKVNNSQNQAAKRNEGFSVFNDILQKSYRKMAFNPNAQKANQASQNPSDLHLPKIAEYQKVDKISSEQAADTILSFISQKLKSDAANGATQEQLLNRLEQGLQGFVKGFNEAKDQIEGMGLLTDDLAAEINDTYERVTKGIEDIRSGINGDAKGQSVNNVSRIQLAGEASQTKSFSLELTTQDGDKVIIDISRADQTSFSSEQNFATNSSLTFNQQSSTSSNFNLNVTGELDDDELTAINQLLEDVDKIAGSFFNGELDKAFEQALSLKIDPKELTSLNLQLQQTSSVKAVAAYESTAQSDTNNTTANSAFKDLNELFNNVQDILNQARQFAEPLKLINDVTNGVTNLLNDNNSQHQLSDLADNLNALIAKFN